MKEKKHELVEKFLVYCFCSILSLLHFQHIRKLHISHLKRKKIIFIAFLFQLESLKESQNIKNASQVKKIFGLRHALIFLPTLGIYCEAYEIHNSNAVPTS